MAIGNKSLKAQGKKSRSDLMCVQVCGLLLCWIQPTLCPWKIAVYSFRYQQVTITQIPHEHQAMEQFSATVSGKNIMGLIRSDCRSGVKKQA